MLRCHFLIWGIVILVSGQAIFAQGPVYFADANLKAAVETSLGVADPTPTDMLGLTSVASSCNGTTD